MTPDFSVARRRANFVDLLIHKKANTYQYRVAASPTFDGTYTTIFTVSADAGYLDPAIDINALHYCNNPNEIRCVFNPNTFTSVASISDSQHIWLKLTPIDYTGATGTAGMPSLVVTDFERFGFTRMQITGNAPQGAAVANSLELWLGQTMKNFYVRNNEAAGGRILYLSLMTGGAEVPVAPQETWEAFDGALDRLVVRGGGGTVNFTANFTNYMPL